MPPVGSWAAIWMPVLVFHGFLMDKGSVVTIDPPGSTFSEAIGINASGQIVGDYGMRAARCTAFYATP